MSDKIRILIVDDNPDDRFLIIRELKKEFEIEPIEVINNEEFSLALEKLNYDVVITDYMLRWTNGIEVTRAIKKKNPLQPVIMFTGSAGEEIAVEAMKEGLDDYIIKSQRHYMRIPIAIKSILFKAAEKKKRNRVEKIQTIAYQIAQAVNITYDLNELFQVIKSALSEIIDTTNFFIALYNKEKDELSLPYIVDIKDTFQVFPAGKTLTAYVIKNDIPILADEKKIDELECDGHIELVGTPSKVWLGVPLKTKDTPIGALVVQSYTDENAYTEDDLEMLQYVSNQVALSIERKKAENEIIDSNKRIQAILRAIPDVMFIYNSDGYILDYYLNSQKEFFITTGSAKGKHIRDILGGSIFSEVQNAMKICSRSRSIHTFEYELFINNEKKYYESRHVMLSEHEFLTIVRNITQSKKDHLALLKEKMRSEESDKLKTAFLSNMSHEIRTPMNAIIGFSSLLSEANLQQDEKEEYIRLISENGNVLLNLINDIIDIAKIEAGEIQISKSPCQLNLMLNQLFEYFKNKNQNSKVEIILSKANDISGFTIHTDALRLRQVYTNLIGNAMKFTDSGKIEFGYTLQNNIIQFFVKDTGIGIAKESREVIFDRFRQADDSFTRKFGGTGLGLTISKNLLKLMGGDIWVQSEVGKGSDFYFTLPYDKSHDTSVTEKERNEKTDKASIYNWKGKTILIAEDVPSNYQFAEAVLRKTEANLIWAKDGQEAVDICLNNSDIDLVLMDIQMPVMNGYEATRKIKVMKPNLPIISQTAYAMLGERELSLEAGCDNYLSKPIRPGDLLSTIAKYF
ncbi:MAG: response regulator [Lentimicrobiaceae bacterium]|nr:response regulator [Lentimicrobiaceae bacterium]